MRSLLEILGLFRKGLGRGIKINMLSCQQKLDREFPVFSDREGRPSVTFQNFRTQAHSGSRQHPLKPPSRFPCIIASVSQHTCHCDDPCEWAGPWIGDVVVTLLDLMTRLKRDIERRQELTIRKCIRINNDNRIKSNLRVPRFLNPPGNGCPFSRLPIKSL